MKYWCLQTCHKQDHKVIFKELTLQSAILRRQEQGLSLTGFNKARLEVREPSSIIETCFEEKFHSETDWTRAWAVFLRNIFLRNLQARLEKPKIFCPKKCFQLKIKIKINLFMSSRKRSHPGRKDKKVWMKEQIYKRQWNGSSGPISARASLTRPYCKLMSVEVSGRKNKTLINSNKLWILLL